MTVIVVVVRPGPLATVQDLGRPGWAHLGVGRSGAADRDSLRLANRLVGNPEGAAGVEITFGGFAARFLAAATVALTGAPAPVTVGGRGAHRDGPLAVPAGAELAVGVPARGARTYLAVRGGLDVPAVFGSRATDRLGGIGPPPLAAGTRLPVGPPPPGFPLVDVAPVPPADPVLPVVPGPRADWFAPGALELLTGSGWEVTADSDRVGLRLAGPRLDHAAARELPTEGLAEGSLQVPPDGRPILVLADHPVTGGYPVLAVLTEAAVARAAQARPGDVLRFRLDRRPAAGQPGAAVRGGPGQVVPGAGRVPAVR